MITVRKRSHYTLFMRAKGLAGNGYYFKSLIKLCKFLDEGESYSRMSYHFGERNCDYYEDLFENYLIVKVRFNVTADKPSNLTGVKGKPFSKNFVK